MILIAWTEWPEISWRQGQITYLFDWTTEFEATWRVDLSSNRQYKNSPKRFWSFWCWWRMLETKCVADKFGMLVTRARHRPIGMSPRCRIMLPTSFFLTKMVTNIAMSSTSLSWDTNIRRQHHNTLECDIVDWYVMSVLSSWLAQHRCNRPN